MRILILPSARDDLSDGFAFYERQEPGLGDCFHIHDAGYSQGNEDQPNVVRTTPKTGCLNPLWNPLSARGHSPTTPFSARRMTRNGKQLTIAVKRKQRGGAIVTPTRNESCRGHWNGWKLVDDQGPKSGPRRSGMARIHKKG